MILDKMFEKNEMGWACGVYGLGDWGVQGLGVETGGKETNGETQAQMGGYYQDGSPGGGMWVCGLDWAGPGQGQVADACECGNEPSGSIKCGEFLDQLQTSQLLEKDSAPWSK